jgi:CBS domain-containing protein
MSLLFNYLEGAPIAIMMCGEIMTRSVVCCVPDDTIEHAATIMKTEDIGPIPVIESHASRRLIGIVTDRDLVIKGIAEGRDAKSTKIRDIMSDHPIACFEQDDINDVINLMSDYKVRRIPVVDDCNHILCIVAQADIATRIGNSKKAGDTIEKLSE